MTEAQHSFSVWFSASDEKAKDALESAISRYLPKDNVVHWTYLGKQTVALFELADERTYTAFCASVLYSLRFIKDALVRDNTGNIITKAATLVRE